MLESITDAFVAVDGNWQFTYVNRTAETLLDQSPGDLIGENLWQVYPGLIGSEFEQIYWGAMRDRVSASVTSFYPDHDRWYEVHTYPAANGITIYFRDVTDRKQIESALRQSEERYRTLFESIDEGFCVVEVMVDALERPIDYRVLEINPTFEQQTGLRQAVGKTARQLGLEDHWIEVYGQVALTGQSVRFENGSQVLNRWFDVYACRFGAPVARKVAIVFKDISEQQAALRERKRAEEISQRTAELNAFRISLADALRPLTDASEIQAIAARILGESLGATRIIYIEVASNGEEVIVHRNYTNGVAELSGRYRLEDYRRNLTADHQAGHTQIVLDIPNNPKYTDAEKAKYRELDIAAHIDVPLIKDDQFVALLAVHQSTPRQWTETEVKLVEETAERTWAAVERARVEADLHQSEERYRMLFESIDEGFCVVEVLFDPAGTPFDHRILQANPGFERHCGIAKPVGKTASELAPGLEQYWNDLYAQVVNTGESVWLENRSDTLDRWFNVLVSRIGDAATHQVAIVFTDITGRKQTETALRQTSDELERQLRKFDAIVAAVPDFIYTFDLAGRFTYINQPLLDLLQKTLAEALGKNFFELDYPTELAARLQNQIQQVIETHQPLKDETPYTSAFGIRAYEYIFVPLFDATGTVEAVAGVTRDITERKQAEAALREGENRLRLALASAALGTWDFNPITGVLQWDDQCKAMFGLSPEAEVNYDIFLAGLHPEDRDRADQVVQFSLTPESGGEYDIEYRTIGIEDGVERWITAKGKAFFNPAGIAIRFIGTVLNITGEEQAEAEREHLLQLEQAAREAAETASRIKDEFLAVLSHELRSPLNPILGWSKLLQQGKLGEAKTTTALATIERNARLQAQLIDDLLDISRILQGKLALNIVPVHLSSVISAALETVRLAIDAKAIQLHLALDPTVEQVLGDAARLQQVVWNLLSNAVKFTPANGQVTVALNSTDRHAQIQVSDTGKGIKPEFLPYVFEHFRQEDGATTRKFGGLGLGLAIASQIVELHGGTIAVDSLGEEQGATFTVQIPLANQLSVLPTSNPPSSSIEDLMGIRILIVDDEADSREFVSFVLKQAGAIVTAVSSGIEALEAFPQVAPNIIVSDIGMPEMDGYMLMRQIRAHSESKQIPVGASLLPKAIALTAYAGEIDQQQALAAGFQKHLAKPVEPEVIVRVIRALYNSEGKVN